MDYLNDGLLMDYLNDGLLMDYLNYLNDYFTSLFVTSLYLLNVTSWIISHL